MIIIVKTMQNKKNKAGSGLIGNKHSKETTQKKTNRVADSLATKIAKKQHKKNKAGSGLIGNKNSKETTHQLHKQQIKNPPTQHITRTRARAPKCTERTTHENTQYTYT
jgi:uncharacterized membrane protein YheB (UPF0754 family)